MIKYKFYRRLRVFFGARSFTKGTNSKFYVIVSGSWTPELINVLHGQGFIEEWDKYA